MRADELGVLLGEQTGDDVGVAGELVEHEGDGRGGGVVAGEQEGHDLVADLQVGEGGFAVLVGGVDQQREDVLAALAGGAAAGDLGVDQAVEGAGGFLLAIPGCEGPAEHAQGVVAGVEGEGLLEEGGGVDGACCGAVGVEAEERAHGDAQGEAAGPGVEVDGGAGDEGHRARRRSRSSMVSSEERMRSWWKAGSMIRREARWKSPSVVSRPSPAKPMRSRK